MSQPTFESAVKSVEDADLGQFSKVGAPGLSAPTMDQLGEVWRIVRPVVVIASTFPFFPAKVRLGLEILIRTIDGLTGTTPPMG